MPRQLNPTWLVLGITLFVIVAAVYQLYVLIRLRQQFAQAQRIPWRVMWFLPAIMFVVGLPINWFIDRMHFPDVVLSASLFSILIAPFAGFAVGMVEKGLVKPFQRYGVCPCGYNLRGNVSGVCPECGSPVNTQRSDESIS